MKDKSINYSYKKTSVEQGLLNCEMCGVKYQRIFQPRIEKFMIGGKNTLMSSLMKAK